MYKVDVLADSECNRQRLTTLEVTFPRLVLAEFNTHRMLSRNSASLRAIPPEKIIEGIKKDPFIPEFNKRVKGMGVGEEIVGWEAESALHWWSFARDNSTLAAEKLAKLDVDKSRANMPLEPYMWQTVIVTATDWDNFLALRNHEEARPEFREIAQMMQDELWSHEPIELYTDEWHLPLINPGNEWLEAQQTKDWDYWAMVSAGRCAKSSYNKAQEREDDEISYVRAKKLFNSGHLSPFEHQACPFTENDIYGVKQLQKHVDMNSRFTHADEIKRMLEYSGNFRYWHQFRKTFENEHNFALVRS